MKIKSQHYSEMEPDWTKPIPNRTVCDFYYLFFWFRAIAAGLLLLTLIFAMSYSKKIDGLLLLTFVVSSAIVVTDTLFSYLICDRALNPRNQ
jgi:hypothetical protein